MLELVIFLLAIVLDILLGEPPAALHPVVWMGKLASLLERAAPRRGPRLRFLYGALVVVLLVGLFSVGSYLLLLYLKGASPILYVLVGALLLKSAFSLRGLRREALRVRTHLVKGELDAARTGVRSLVGRDTGGLDEPQVVSAVVESVAENTCDSFVAPVFFFLFLGVPGALAYRVINTLDAMMGYHGPYEHLGKFAARLDDVLNWIPARLSGLLLVLAASWGWGDGRAAWRDMQGQHGRTESPNAGWTMSAAAGALGVELQKAGHYTLGRGGRPLSPETIDSAVRLMLAAATIWALVSLTIMGWRFVLAS
ncbi:MAG: cobalamin biosynthesis protein [Dehalococcoidia bacterium]